MFQGIRKSLGVNVSGATQIPRDKPFRDTKIPRGSDSRRRQNPRGGAFCRREKGDGRRGGGAGGARSRETRAIWPPLRAAASARVKFALRFSYTRTRVYASQNLLVSALLAHPPPNRTGLRACGAAIQPTRARPPPPTFIPRNFCTAETLIPRDFGLPETLIPRDFCLPETLIPRDFCIPETLIPRDFCIP